MLISIPCHIFCSGKRLPIPAARPYLSVYSKWPPRGKLIPYELKRSNMATFDML